MLQEAEHAVNSGNAFPLVVLILPLAVLGDVSKVMGCGLLLCGKQRAVC